MFRCSVSSSPATLIVFLRYDVTMQNRNVARPSEIYEKLTISQGRQGTTLQKRFSVVA